MIDMFLDNHGLHSICDCIDCVSRVEPILDLYDLMIMVFREGTFKLDYVNHSLTKSTSIFWYQCLQNNFQVQ